MYKVTYKIDSDNIEAAAHAIAIGQSIGNPSIKTEYDNYSHAAEILSIEKDEVVNADGTLSDKGNEVVIGYQYKNLNSVRDVAQMLCTIQGGQSDINVMTSCRVVDIKINIPGKIIRWKLPTNRPLVGGIVKPKTGLSKNQLTDIIRRMCDGGIDWIKEDEILGDPSYFPFEERAYIVSEVLKDYPNVMYCLCANGSPIKLLENYEIASLVNLGVHTNIWSGLGSYYGPHKVFQHFQRSGVRTITDPRNPYGIDWHVLVKLAILQDVDSIHVGMLGGYYPESKDEVLKAIELCQNHRVIPTLSCGMNPEIAQKIQDQIGNNWMACVGGWFYDGDITENVKKMRKAFEN